MVAFNKHREVVKKHESFSVRSGDDLTDLATSEQKGRDEWGNEKATY